MVKKLEGVLHTSSLYGITEIDLNFSVRSDQEVENSIQRLESTEKQLYEQFGANNYEQFIEILREVFRDKDIEVIRRFEPAALSKSLEKFAGKYGNLYGEDVQLSFDFSKVNTQKYKVRSEYNNTIVTIPPLTWGFQNIKEKLNEYFQGRNFKYTAPVMKDANRMIEDLISSGALTITTKDMNNNFSTVQSIVRIKNFPWGLLRSQYDDAIKYNDIDLLKEVDKAGKTIKNFILNELGAGASEKLKTAIKWTWAKNFNQYENNPALFFSGGETNYFISGVQGALGEFQTALIFTFLQQEIGCKVAYAKIIGNIYKKGTGEQLKTDVQVADAIGLQVKNINIIKQGQNNVLLRDLESNIHPKALAPLLDNSQQFLDFIANYFFNKTFQEETYQAYNEMLRMLGSYLGEVMNMAVGESAMKDKISFYVIAGKYLVPASVILRASQELNLAKNLAISSKYNALPDKAFEMPFHINPNGKRSPLYVEYWTHPYGNNSAWRPTALNKQEYNYLISTGISIKTTFNLIKKIEQYALF